MEHKGHEYSIVQAASPRGYVWRVTVGDKTRTGTTISRIAARLKAQKVIDTLIGMKATADAKATDA